MTDAAMLGLDDARVVAATRAWLERAVIGLGLCPFAKAVHVKGQIRYRVSRATSARELEGELGQELALLAAADPTKVDTALLIHPFVLQEFLSFNAFLRTAERMLEKLGLVGELQVASFHPQYQFARNDSDDMANYSNRSPYPTLHLLREASVDRAVKAFPDAATIFEKNAAALRSLGHAGWERVTHGSERSDDEGSSGA